jgi:hypothetical protein
MPTYLTDRLLLSTTLLGLSDFFILEATATDIPKMVTTDVTAGMNQVSILLTHRDKMYLQVDLTLLFELSSCTDSYASRWYHLR